MCLHVCKLKLYKIIFSVSKVLKKPNFFNTSQIFPKRYIIIIHI